MTPSVAAAMLDHCARELRRLLDELDRIERARKQQQEDD